MFEILKRSWNSQETPPWFNELITETIEIYKQKSEQLPASDNELSEFHEQVMSLNYELGLLWENYWSEYEFDLATVRNYLQKCIEYFEKLPNDYVDPAMKIDRDEAANILSDINENNQKLQTSLVESSPLERIQLLINLGQLPENDIIPENLKTIPDQKQEVLLQQIRCMQLARLINTMEEDELFTSFQGAELNDEQASTLMNARQLATTNQLPTDDCGEDVNERLIYGAVKERILQMIRSEIRENKASLTQVKTNIEEYFKTKLGENDILIVEDEFKKYSFKLFKEDISPSVKSLFESKDEHFILELFDSLESITYVQEIPLETIVYYKTELQTLLTQAEENELVNHFKLECTVHTITYCNSIIDELSFLNCLVSFLSNSRNLIQIFSKLELEQCNRDCLPPAKELLKKIIGLEMEEENDNLSRLKAVTHRLLTQKYVILEAKFLQTIQDFLVPVKFEEINNNDHFIIEIIGNHVLLSNVLGALEEKFQTSGSLIEEVRFICGQAFHIDTDLVSSVWHGKNIAVRTKLAKVHGSVVWDVSGEDNKHVYHKKADTSVKDGAGKPGNDGYPGESGGNVLILAEQIDNINGWTVVSNGGKGSNGQDGGDGRDGQDGVGITKETIESKILKPKSWFAMQNQSAGLGQLTEQIIEECAEINTRIIDSYCRYIEATTAEGNEIIFCYSDGWSMVSQCYFIYKGSIGKPGGAGGASGEGGQGGFPGMIVVKNIKADTTLDIRKQALQGTDGTPGLGGFFGNHGRNGWDMGFMDYRMWTEIVAYGLDENTKLSLNYGNESLPNSVWCWKKEKYLSFSTSNVNQKQVTHTKRAAERHARKQHAQATMKASIVEGSFKSSTDQFFSSSESDSMASMITKIEATLARAAQAMEQKQKQETKVNKEVKVHRSIALTSFNPVNTTIFPNIADIIDKKVDVERILKNLKPTETNLESWKKIKTVPVTYRQLETAFASYEKMIHPIPKEPILSEEDDENPSTQRELSSQNSATCGEPIVDDWEVVRTDDMIFIFMNKFKLATLEEISPKLSLSKSVSSSTLELLPYYATSCLEEIPNEQDLSSHSIEILGTITNCLHKFNHSEQRNNLRIFCQQDQTSCVSACLQVFIQEANEFDEVDPSAKEYFNQFKSFESQQREDLDNFWRNCDSEGLLPRYQSIIDTWQQDKPVGPNMLKDIKKDSKLGDFYKSYLLIKNRQFDFKSCLENENTLKAYLELVHKSGPKLRSYRELLARAFGVNIRLYVRSNEGKLLLKDNHNSDAKDILNLLFSNETFTQLYINKDHLELLTERLQKIEQFSLVLDCVQSLHQKEEFEKIIADPTTLKINNLYKKNESKAKCFDKVIEEVTTFVAPKDQPFLTECLTSLSALGNRYQEVIHSILFRFSHEGKHIDQAELHFLIDCIVSTTDAKDTDLYRWIVMACDQKSWTVELVLIQLENYFKCKLSGLDTWKMYMARLKNRGILILLSAKLVNCRPGNFVSVKRMEEILHMMSLVTLKTADLSKLELSEWFYSLEEIYCKQRLQDMVRWNASRDKEKLNETSYYAVAFMNNFNFELTRHFFDLLKQKTSEFTTSNADIVDIFCNIYNGKWGLSKEELFYLKDCDSVQQWKKKMEIMFEGDDDRDVSTIVKLMTGSQNASKTILNILTKVEQCVKETKNISTDCCITPSAIVRQIMEIDEAIYKCRRFKLRDTQKVAILTMLENTNNTLVQVATGEGKSLIVAAVAIIKAQRKEKVDIITSSSVLAKRDADVNGDIYKEFKINVSHNCNEDIEARKDTYSKYHVIYGDLASFQRDYLLHNFYQKNVLGDRKFQNVIVDEVDSMLLDRGNNMLYLSHDLPDMDKLEVVYLFIWNWLNTTLDFDSRLIKHAILWNIYGVIQLSDISKIDETLDETAKLEIWEVLIEAEIIDQKGFLIIETVNKNVITELLGPSMINYVDRLVYFVNNLINREKSFTIPNYMRPFVELHLDSWIDAAKKAFCMEVGQDYVVDVDRSGSSGDRSPNVIILDRDTGTDMVNSQWEAALHQFIQLKHGCKTSLQSLKAVFVSNVTYFKKYKNLYGLTGTLGSHRERDQLGEIYNVDFANIPTAKCKKFYEDLPVICSNTNDWIEAIHKIVTNITRIEKRSVLIICDTLNAVSTLHNGFKQKDCKFNMRTYTRDYEQFDEGKLTPGEVIIATNLAGRGTDIKITHELKRAGGLHICLTYLPSNVRIEQQAFGRAARSGDRGSGQLIIVSNEGTDTSSARMLHLKRERDAYEMKRISSIKEYYETQIVTEEKWFAEFANIYRILEKTLLKKNLTNKSDPLRQVLLESCLDRWAFWLDANCQNIHGNDVNNQLNSFLANLKSLKCNSIDDLKAWVIKSPPQTIKLGCSLLKEKEKRTAVGTVAIDSLKTLVSSPIYTITSTRDSIYNWKQAKPIDFFNEVIKQEPLFCEAAHYYKACALSQEINWDANPINPNELLSFKEELHAAATLINDRILVLTACVSLVDKHKINDRSNLVQIDSYKAQKETVCVFYDMLIQSINNILGHPVTPSSFIDGSTIDEAVSHDIFDELLQSGVLSKPILKRNIPTRELEHLKFSFGLSSGELQKFFQEFCNNNGEYIDLSLFTRSVKQEFVFPSRESFWNILRGQELLKDEIRYVVIDTDKQVEFSKKWKETPGSGLIMKGIQQGLNDILLYPMLNDQQHTLIFDRTQFKVAIGDEHYKKCKDRGIFKIQRKAQLVRNRSHVVFHQFDSISLEDFDRINITRDDAERILSHLEQNQVLQKNDDYSYALNIKHIKIENIQLPSYKIYERVVKDLLYLCFSYRLAWETMMSQSSIVFDIPLTAKPHRALAAELVAKDIIQPASLSKYTANSKLELDLPPNVIKVLEKYPESIQPKTIKSTLENLRGKLDTLKPLYGRSPEVDKEDWDVFTLNGLDMIIKVDNSNWFQVFKKLFDGVARIATGFCFNWVTTSLHINSTKGKQLMNDGLIKMSESLTMTGKLFLANYDGIKCNEILKKLILMNAKYLSKIDSEVLKFGQGLIRSIQKINTRQSRRINQIIDRGFDATHINIKNESLVRYRLKVLCTGLKGEIFNMLENHEWFNIVSETLKHVSSDQAGQIAEKILNRSQYQDELKIILGQISESTLSMIEDATQNSGANQAISSIVLDSITRTEKTVFEKHSQRFDDHIKRVLRDLEGNLSVVVDKSIETPQPCVETTIKQWQNMMRKNFTTLMDEKLMKPVMDQGSTLLNQYFERQNDSMLGVAAQPTHSSDRTLRTRKLRREMNMLLLVVK